MSRLFTILLAASLIGCASRNVVTFADYRREIVLSSAHPEDSFIKARLVEISPDGTTTIYAIPTGRELRAAVGCYFVSEEYGRIGLQLISASAEKHEARFVWSTGSITTKSPNTALEPTPTAP